ncbi:hypothetical protein NERG_01145 [Nematocida ausubeli]|uniref:Uncharacterized protein n=1 Tax=Nematocida ausubeli (strain ATCC PRA-371 / ERTm2) TaxID=1913371 RepID=H8ZCZ8_NEMA1|nr:hypothetical protein NERG_01145 [Nematocida ausubeli]
MNRLALSSVYGSSTATVSAYNEKTGELFVGVDRVIKKTKIRSGSATVLKLETERQIKSISIDKDLLLALDVEGRVYLYNLAYNVEIGRMLNKECHTACVLNGKIHLEFMGYLQVWVIEENGFFTFRKEKHITGHQDNIILMERTEEGLLTGSKDGVLRLFSSEDSSSETVARNKSHPLCARKVGQEISAVWASGEITKLIQVEDAWTPIQKKYTMHNLLDAAISTYGDMAVLLDTSHNVLLYSTTGDTKEPIQKIFVSDGIKHVQFVEEDEWIILSGNGSVVWEWKTNTLLFNEQASSGQTVARDIEGSVVSGTVSGDVFMWDKGSSLCLKKIAAHSSAVSAIIPTERGFISASANGECKVHKASGTVIKQISAEIPLLVADADEDILAVAGPGKMHTYDIKRSKLIQEYDIDMPLAIKMMQNGVLLISMQGITTYSPDSVSGKDGPEQFVNASISETKDGLKISCLGESGMVYTYNHEMEELVEYRALPKYTNGMGKNTPLGMVHTENAELIITYKTARPDKVSTFRETIFASMFYNGQEIDKWKVAEHALSSSGYLFTQVSAFGALIGICTESGLYLFSSAETGMNSLGAWQKETPQEVSQQIEKGDVLSGLIGAIALQSPSLVHMALSSGDPVVLAKYLPSELALQSVSVVLSAMSNGLVERALMFLEEILKKIPVSSVLRRQIILILSSVINTSHETTGYADALVTFPHLALKEIEE